MHLVPCVTTNASTSRRTVSTAFLPSSGEVAVEQLNSVEVVPDGLPSSSRDTIHTINYGKMLLSSRL